MATQAGWPMFIDELCLWRLGVWPGRELNPRHADFQGVTSRPVESCGDRLGIFQQRLTVPVGVAQYRPELSRDGEFRY
jgi:hypothetical protein